MLMGKRGGQHVRYKFYLFNCTYVNYSFKLIYKFFCIYHTKPSCCCIESDLMDYLTSRTMLHTLFSLTANCRAGIVLMVSYEFNSWNCDKYINREDMKHIYTKLSFASNKKYYLRLRFILFQTWVSCLDQGQPSLNYPELKIYIK